MHWFCLKMFYYLIVNAFIYKLSMNDYNLGIQILYLYPAPVWTPTIQPSEENCSALVTRRCRATQHAWRQLSAYKVTLSRSVICGASLSCFCEVQQQFKKLRDKSWIYDVLYFRCLQLKWENACGAGHGPWAAFEVGDGILFESEVNCGFYFCLFKLCNWWKVFKIFPFYIGFGLNK